MQSSPMSSSPPHSPLQLSSLHHSFSNVSFVSRHICGNLLLLALSLSEIIGPNLVRTTTHLRCIHMYLRMVGALMLTENFLDINLCSSTEVTSSSSCSFASTKAAISAVIFDCRPERCWSLKPRLVLQRNAHLQTVACKVLLPLVPLDSKIIKILETFFPTPHEATICSLR